MAGVANAIAATLAAGASCAANGPALPDWRGRTKTPRRLSSVAAALALLFSGTAAPAASNKVRIGNIADISFGTVATLTSDAVSSQSLCVYADTSSSGYNVTATGTGPGGTFALSSGSHSLAFDVLWSSTPGQSSGVQLAANVPLTGQISSATQQSCNNGPATSASLVVVLRSAALSNATAGAYSGTLTLLIGPE